MRKFMRTSSAAGPAPAPAHAAPLANGHPSTNGHANGGAGSRRDDHSTLSSAGAAALWEDPEFPAGWRALGSRRLAAGVVWRRPHELSVRPTFLGEEDGAGAGGASEASEAALAQAHWDVAVGALGSAALCAAACALALTPSLLARVAPHQPFRARYSGAFRFRFWVFGAWREVCVDDRLPCRASGPASGSASGASGRAPARLLASTPASGDYMLPLLEKAYAKLYGSYVAMRAGGGGGAGGAEAGARALQELTGGVVQSFSLARQPRALTLHVLREAAPRCTLLVARAAPAPGRAYCVTGLARVRGARPAALVRVRAPGRGACARGPPEWSALHDADRDLLDARALHPDEFWMSFEEFTRSFSWLELVHVGPDDWAREPALRARRPWRAVLARRRWRRGFNAGGPPDAAETAGANPQFHVQIPCGAGAGAEDRCHVVVSVTQQYSPRARGALRGIGFALYEVPAGGTRAGPACRALRGLRALDVAHSGRAREVASFFTLPPGEYLLVPHTRRAHEDAAFLLRVLTDQHANIWEVNEDNMILQSISSEFPDERQPLPPETRTMLGKLFGDEEVEEVDAAQLRRALRRAGGGAPGELCRALVALRDAGASGRMAARDVPALLRVLAGWRACWARARARRCGRASSYRLRELLWAAGVRASNKVLEAVVARFAPRAALSPHAYLLALARIHLAHERFRSLDTKLKSNPLSLEEMILMTIYS